MNKFFRLTLFNRAIWNCLSKVLFITLVFLSIAAKIFCQNDNSSPRLLAYKYLQANQINEAEFAFLKAIKTNPREILNYRDLAVLYLSKKNYSKAESTAKSGLSLQPGNIEMRSVLAKIYLEKKDKQTAVRELNDIIKRDPRNVFAYYALA